MHWLGTSDRPLQRLRQNHRHWKVRLLCGLCGICCSIVFALLCKMPSPILKRRTLHGSDTFASIFIFIFKDILHKRLYTFRKQNPQLGVTNSQQVKSNLHFLILFDIEQMFGANFAKMFKISFDQNKIIVLLKVTKLTSS